jgi:hypothetical protein
LDIGCGDGRILLQWAERVSSSILKEEGAHNTSHWTAQDASSLSFLGIDIDSNRIEECKIAAKQASDAGRIHRNIRIEFTCANASESAQHFQNATVIFMYLIPRGLNLIFPLIREHANRMLSEQDTTIRVATYMSKLPSEAGPPLHKATCCVPHQPDAAWPLYFYEFKNDGAV